MPLALRTPRLLLREWRDEDLAPFVAMSADPEAMRYLPSLERSAAEAWVARIHRHFDEHGFGNFVVELPGKASFIGVVGLNHVRWNLAFTPAVEAAWRLMPAYWGQGYALEAARAALGAGGREHGGARRRLPGGWGGRNPRWDRGSCRGAP